MELFQAVSPGVYGSTLYNHINLSEAVEGKFENIT